MTQSRFHTLSVPSPDHLLGVGVLSMLLAACGTFFGKKTDLSFIQQPDFSVRQVAYVPIQPVVTGFDSLTDVCAGFDQLIYAVDAAREQVIAFDESFVRLSSLRVPGATKLMQTRSLQLYVLGHSDTLIQGFSYRLPTIYKYDMVQTSGYGLAHAGLVRKLVFPFHFGRTSIKTSDTLVRFVDITPLADGTFYVARIGPTSSDVLTGPDDAIVTFSRLDEYIGFVQVLTSNGTEERFIRRPVAVTSFVQPPLTDRVAFDFSFAYLTSAPSDQQKAKVISGVFSEFGPVFTVEDLNAAATDREKADGGLYEFGKFTSPTDIAFAGDGTQLLFVTDAAKDSVYIFTRTGLEGVVPPVGSTSKKNINVSFGGRGNSLYQFDRPVAVTYQRKILIVADQGNKRILRYKLTTDFE